MRSITFAFAITGILALLAGACGSDVQTQLIQVEDPHLGEHLFDGTTDGRECVTSTQCEDGDHCSLNRCVERRCVSFTVPTEECCPTEVLFEELFEGPLGDGISLSQISGSAGWHQVEDVYATPPGALYFGDLQTRTYDTGERVGGSVTFPALDLPTDRETLLTFRLYAAIETSLEYDLFTVEADVIEGGQISSTRTLLEKRNLPPAVYEGFALVTARLDDLAGRRVILRMTFDSVDDMNNAYEGLYLDDIRVLASCPLPVASCTADEECDDGDACTASVCTEIGCVDALVCELPGPGPVVDPELNPCADPEAPADCCTLDAECDDGDPATINVCEGSTCVATLNPDQCLSDADCQDGDACTLATCLDGVCQFQGTIGAGCCAPSTFHVADFDNETLQGIYVTDNFETGIFWRPDSARATSGHFSLYCGDPIRRTYSHDRRVKSSATTRTLEIPSGGQTSLAFDLLKRTRLTRNFDVFQVFVLRDGALLPAWSSKSLHDGTTASGWQRITVPLHQYAGQTIQIRFVFDSVDAPTGLFEGTYIDTIGLETVCR